MFYEFVFIALLGIALIICIINLVLNQKIENLERDNSRLIDEASSVMFALAKTRVMLYNARKRNNKLEREVELLKENKDG